MFIILMLSYSYRVSMLVIIIYSIYNVIYFDYIVFFLFLVYFLFFFFSSRRRHTRYWRDWSSDVCSSDLPLRRLGAEEARQVPELHRLGQLVHAVLDIGPAHGRRALRAKRQRATSAVVEDRKSVV